MHPGHGSEQHPDRHHAVPCAAAGSSMRRGSVVVQESGNNVKKGASAEVQRQMHARCRVLRAIDTARG